MIKRLLAASQESQIRFASIENKQANLSTPIGGKGVG